MSETETTSAGTNGAGTTVAESGGQKIEMKVTPMKPFGGSKEKAKSEEAEILSALGARAKDSWSVNRISAKGYPRATLGVLEVTVTADDIKQGRLHAKLGAGTYELVNLADPKEKYVLPLGTQTPPQEFGTPAPDEGEDVLVMDANGQPAMVKMPSRPGQQRGGWFQPPPLPGYGGAWQGNPQAPQADPALKATLDLMVKMLEKMADKKDDGPDSKTLLELKKMEVDAAKAEAASRAAVAKTEADARVAEARVAADLRIAEFKAKSEADRESAKSTAQIQADAAKAIATAQSAQATAFAQAQERAASAQLEAAKANASAIVEAAKAKAQGESGMFERLLKMQEEKGQVPPAPTILEQFGEIEQLRKMLAPPSADGIAAGINAAKDAAVSVIANLIALRSTAVKYVLVGPDGQPVQQQAPVPQVAVKQVTQLGPDYPPGGPTPGAMPAQQAAALLAGTAGAAPDPAAKPATPADAAAVEEAKVLARQVLDGLKSLEDGAKRQVDPARMAAVLREKLPRVYAWLRETTPDAILGEIQTMIEQPAFSDGERKAALACRTALAGDLVWLLNVLNAVKA